MMSSKLSFFMLGCVLLASMEPSYARVKRVVKSKKRDSKKNITNNYKINWDKNGDKNEYVNTFNIENFPLSGFGTLSGKELEQYQYAKVSMECADKEISPLEKTLQEVNKKLEDSKNHTACKKGGCSSGRPFDQNSYSPWGPLADDFNKDNPGKILFEKLHSHDCEKSDKRIRELEAKKSELEVELNKPNENSNVMTNCRANWARFLFRPYYACEVPTYITQGNTSPTWKNSKTTGGTQTSRVLAKDTWYDALTWQPASPEKMGHLGHPDLIQKKPCYSLMSLVTGKDQCDRHHQQDVFFEFQNTIPIFKDNKNNRASVVYPKSENFEINYLTPEIQVATFKEELSYEKLLALLKDAQYCLGSAGTLKPDAPRKPDAQRIFDVGNVKVVFQYCAKGFVGAVIDGTKTAFFMNNNMYEDDKVIKPAAHTKQFTEKLTDQEQYWVFKALASMDIADKNTAITFAKCANVVPEKTAIVKPLIDYRMAEIQERFPHSAGTTIDWQKELKTDKKPYHIAELKAQHILGVENSNQFQNTRIVIKNHPNGHQKFMISGISCAEEFTDKYKDQLDFNKILNKYNTMQTAHFFEKNTDLLNSPDKARPTKRNINKRNG